MRKWVEDEVYCSCRAECKKLNRTVLFFPKQCSEEGCEVTAHLTCLGRDCDIPESEWRRSDCMWFCEEHEQGSSDEEDEDSDDGDGGNAENTGQEGGGKQEEEGAVPARRN